MLHTILFLEPLHAATNSCTLVALGDLIACKEFSYTDSGALCNSCIPSWGMQELQMCVYYNWGNTTVGERCMQYFCVAQVTGYISLLFPYSSSMNNCLGTWVKTWSHIVKALHIGKFIWCGWFTLDTLCTNSLVCQRYSYSCRSTFTMLSTSLIIFSCFFIYNVF